MFKASFCCALDLFRSSSSSLTFIGDVSLVGFAEESESDAGRASLGRLFATLLFLDIVVVGADLVACAVSMSANAALISSSEDVISMSSKSPARVNPDVVELLPLLVAPFLVGAIEPALLLDAADVGRLAFGFARLNLGGTFGTTEALPLVFGAEGSALVSDVTRAGGLKAFFDACVAPGKEGIRCIGGMMSSRQL